MGQQYLIDSNAVIDFLSGKLPEKGLSFMNQVINDIPNLSVITKIEVLGYKTTPPVFKLLTDFFNDSTVVGISDDIVEQTIEIRRNHKIKTPDAIIAATAIVSNYALITRNVKDFTKIVGLDLVCPHDI